MRIFVTGANGFIGSAVVQDLLAAGHQVVGLAHRPDVADQLARWGVEAHPGQLSDPETLARGARGSDGVIHLAYIHDFSQFVANAAIDVRAVQAMTNALEGTGKSIVIASGTMMVAHARPATETEAPLSPDGPRAASEIAVLAEGRGIRGAVVRLAPSIHDTARQGLVTSLIAMAREKGVSPYVGDGENVWPAAHRVDAARLFRLAVERAEPGTRLHAVAEEGIPLRAIAEAIGERLGVPARSVTAEEAPAHFGPFAMFVQVSNPASSALTRERFGWAPTGPGLLTGLREGDYIARAA
jgi:nucleoside-diphosphate-sugar epimerase